MPFSQTSGARFGYVAETAFGVAPVNPAFKAIRATGTGLRTNKATGQSDEIRYDRNVVDEFQFGQDAAGNYDVEFSYGSFDDFIAAAMFSDWTANVIKNGVTPKSLLIEETLRTGGVLNSFSRYYGAMVNSFSLNLTARQKITGSIGLMAQKETLAGAILTGATYLDPSTEPVLTASAHVGGLTVSGAAGIKLRSAQLSIENNLRTRPVIGSNFSEEFGSGRCSVTGTIEAYFETNDLYQRVLDHGGGALSLTVGAETGKKYRFDLPKIIFLNGEKRRGGVDDDVMVNIPIRAVLDTTLGASISITRAVA